MVLSTLGVAADVTPSVIETFFSHARHANISRDSARMLTPPTVSQSQTAQRKTYRPCLIPRGSAPDPPISRLRFSTHRRRHPGFYWSMGPHSHLGQAGRSSYLRCPFKTLRRHPQSTAWSRRPAKSWRSRMVAMATTRDCPER
jgi:hypothetical protein